MVAVVLSDAGCLHQVYNFEACVKLAEDFVAPEHISACLEITDQFRRLPLTHARSKDKLQVSCWRVLSQQYHAPQCHVVSKAPCHSSQQQVMAL